MVGLHDPAEAASHLGLPTSTLRLYSVRFRSLLSEHAAPTRAGVGRIGHRRYTDKDLEMLAGARDLVKSGSSFDEALTELGGRPPQSLTQATDRDGLPTRLKRQSGQLASHADTHLTQRSVEANGEPISRQSIESGAKEAPSIQPAALNQFIAAAIEGWRSLAQHQRAEIDRLQNRVTELENEIREMRRPWWQRIFS